MKPVRTPALSLLTLGALAVALFVVLSQGRPASAQNATKPAPAWEYKMMTDVNEQSLKSLTEDGWEYVGYLGTGVKGIGTDETLWKHPKK